MIVTEPPHLLLASGTPASGLHPGSRFLKPAPFRKRELSRFLALVTKTAGVDGKVSVLLTDDETIRGLNRQFRKENSATDVLSFPAAPAPELKTEPKRKLAGDLAISLTTAARQAAEYGHALEVEVKILLLHGVLHLSGFDHETDDGEMARRESVLRKKLGLPVGLIARSGEAARSAKKKATVKKKPAGEKKKTPSRRSVRQ